jgi:predicted RNA binding protein YcfA (HicA-like mRNA interferase family)
MAKSINSRQIIRRLGKDGWKKARQKGSHMIFRHADRPGSRVVVPHPKDSFKPNTLRDIFRCAGWDWPP